MVEKRDEKKAGKEETVKCPVCGKEVPVPPGQKCKEMVPTGPEEYRHIDNNTGEPCEGMGMVCQRATEACAKANDIK